MRISPKKKKEKVPFRISFVILFFTASFLICFTMYMKENQPESYYESGGEIISAKAKEEEGSARKTPYLKSCIFAGGNVLERLCGYEYIPSAKAFFGDGLTEENVLAAADSSAVGGIYFFPDISSESSFEHDMLFYDELIGRLKEKNTAPIYILSALPAADAEGTAVTDGVNRRTAAFCRERGIYFLDVCEELKDKNGVLPDIYVSENGMTREVYGRITSYILSHAV